MTTSLAHLSEIDLAKIRRFAEGRVPSRAHHQVRLELDVHGPAVTIVERRAPWSPTIGPDWTSNPIDQAPVAYADALADHAVIAGLVGDGPSGTHHADPIRDDGRGT